MLQKIKNVYYKCCKMLQKIEKCVLQFTRSFLLYTENKYIVLKMFL